MGAQGCVEPCHQSAAAAEDQWPTQIVYQWGATLKAYTFETSC